MHKINSSSLTNRSLFAVPLENLIPKSHPKRVILDQLPWAELVKIARLAYKSDYWKDKPNPRVMAGLFIWHCITGDKPYRDIEDDFSFNKLCIYACGFQNDDQLRTIHHTALIKFEEHLGQENILKIKDIIEQSSVKKQPSNSKGRHSGDSTVFESNITYPTDTKLMEAVRKFLVKDIIIAYQKDVGQNHRPYDRVARKEYLNFCKNRNPFKKQIQQIKKKQLQFLKRNLRQAEKVIVALDQNNRLQLKGKQNQKAFKRLKTKLQTAKLIYRQQLTLYHGEKIKNRIVSFHRPNVRPIFRGKAHKKTEFGFKAELAIMGKTLILGKTSYDNFYDGHGLQETIAQMKSKDYLVKEIIGDKGHQGCCRFFKEHQITNGLEIRGKRDNAPPIPKKRFIRARNKMEGAIGTIKNVFIRSRLKAKTDFGDLKELCKAVIGYNLTYAFAAV